MWDPGELDRKVKIAATIEQDAGYFTCKERLATDWSDYLKDQSALTSSDYKTLVKKSQSLAIWSKLTATATAEPAIEEMSITEACDPSTTHLFVDWCVGSALAQAVVDSGPDIENVLVHANALVSGLEPRVCREAFLRSINCIMGSPLRDRVVKALHQLAQRIASEAPDNVFTGDKEQFKAALKEWREAPDWEAIWCSHIFEHFMVFESRADILGIVEKSDPALFLELLEETKTPAVMLMTLPRDFALKAICRASRLLQYAPECFEQDPDTGIYCYNGCMAVPILFLRVMDALQDPLARCPPTAVNEEKNHILSHVSEVAHAVASRRDGPVLAVHAVAWILSRQRMFKNRSNTSSFSAEVTMIEALIEAIARGDRDLPNLHVIDSALTVLDEKELCLCLETGRASSVSSDNRLNAFDRLTAYTAILLAMWRQAHQAKADVERHLTVCQALYRQMLVQQSISVRSSFASVEANIWGLAFQCVPEPASWWQDLWNELAQQRHRSGYRLKEEFGLFNSSILHLDVGIAVLDWTIADEAPLPNWVRPLWCRLLGCALHAEPVVMPDVTLNQRVVSLFGRIAHLAKKLPDNDWVGVAAQALRSLGGDAYLMTRSVESLYLNNANVPDIANRYDSAGGKVLADSIETFLNWDAARQDLPRKISEETRQRLQECFSYSRI